MVNGTAKCLSKPVVSLLLVNVFLPGTSNFWQNLFTFGMNCQRIYKGFRMPIQKIDAAGNLRGSMFMLLAMASFAIGDTIMKTVSDTLPLSQILVIRGCFAIVCFFLIALYVGALRHPRVIFAPAFMLRLIGEVVASLFFLTALFNMPIANASAIMQALPLTVSLGAAYFFGEAIGWRRILAITVGLFGVLLIVKPGYEGFTIYSVYCLIAVLGTTLRDLATRKVDKSIPSIYVSLITVVVIVLMGLLMSLFQPWAPANAEEVLTLGAASIFLMTGFIGIVSAMRVGEVAVVTPFRYTVLIFAVILGYLVFKEIPDIVTIIGSCIVVASGLYTLYRENFMARRKRKAERT